MKQASLKQASRKQAPAKPELLKPEPLKEKSSKHEPLKLAGSQIEPVKWSELSGWASDDHLAAFAAYQAGCRAARKRPTHRRSRANLRRPDQYLPQGARFATAGFRYGPRLLRAEFSARAHRAPGRGRGPGDRLLRAGRCRLALSHPEFPVPIYRRPRDLVAPATRRSTAFPTRAGGSAAAPGPTTSCRTTTAAPSRPARSTARKSRYLIKDALDLVTNQIEGSARVILEDGTPLRISYNSHNGYSYSSIERVLVERNLIPRKEMSREHVRAWMAAHPEEAAKVRAVNRSYSFFRVTGLTNDGEPVGARGVPLTPGRSIAVDRVHEYGTPFFIEGNLPIESAKPNAPVGRLTIAQDTGSAIVGPARRSLSRRQGRGRPRCRPHQASRPFRDARPARARSRRGGERAATAGAEAEDRAGRSREAGREAGRQGQGGACRLARARQADAGAGGEDQDRRARRREAKQQGQGRDPRRTRETGQQASAVARAEDKDHRERKREAGSKGQSGTPDNAAWTVAGKQKLSPRPRPRSPRLKAEKKPASTTARARSRPPDQ